MALLTVDAQQFVVVGQQLRDELDGQELFCNYFENKKDKLSTLDSIEKLTIDNHTDLSKTIFVIKHFNSCETNRESSDVTNHTLESEDKQNVETYNDDGPFKILSMHRCSIMGSMALIQLIRQMKSLDDPIKMIPTERPLHNLAMHDTLITFSGISSKLEAQKLLTLTRYMGAKSREDITNKTTHLVAGNPRGMKYRRALELGLCIMNTSWVTDSFKLAQDDPEFEACSPEMIQKYKLKPFQGLFMAFVGFREDDITELKELTIANNGYVVDSIDTSCTHIVIDAISGSDEDVPDYQSSINQSTKAHVVYREWFWASLEMEGKANEDVYAVPGFRPQARRSSRAHQTSGYNSFGNVLSPMLDYSRSPETISRQLSRSTSLAPGIRETPDLSKATPRHRLCLELLQTERNYVRVLETIVTMFKVPLESSDSNDPILPMTDIKIIFGNLTPIYECHKKMLSKLERLIEHDWQENNLIGEVFVLNAMDLLKAYPPFVNFFEDTKKTIKTCDAQYPRFHAFLRRCQSTKECKRESLTEMMIRPVQRLPSITLIIDGLIKKTDDNNPDREGLVEALDIIRKVMNLINEDKRKTEGQIAMFDIVNNIEDCPPNLLSALRRFVCKAEARLLFMNSESEIAPSRSHKVVLFLFSDLIEICKVRSLKRSHSSRGPRTYVPLPRRALNHGANQTSKLSSHKKEHRHLDELRLCDIMNLYKSCKSSEMAEAFVIQARPSSRYDQNFRYYPFVIEDDSITKDTFIERLDEALRDSDDPEQASDYNASSNNNNGTTSGDRTTTSLISNEEIDFGFANSLVASMEKSRLSRVLSIKQALLSPSVKAQRNQFNNAHNH